MSTPLLIVGFIVIAIIGYLIGSISASIIVSKFLKHDDIRNHGSKNAGMTNVLRTYGKKYAVITLLGDFFKAVIAVVIGGLIAHYVLKVPYIYGDYVAGIAALMGHIFPIYFGFRGGKGILTTAGVILCMDYRVLIALVAVFLLVALTTKIVSLGSITVAVLYPVFTALFAYLSKAPVLYDTIFAAIIGIIVLYMHRENIKRLINGTEHKFGQKK